MNKRSILNESEKRDEPYTEMLRDEGKKDTVSRLYVRAARGFVRKMVRVSGGMACPEQPLQTPRRCSVQRQKPFSVISISKSVCLYVLVLAL